MRKTLHLRTRLVERTILQGLIIACTLFLQTSSATAASDAISDSLVQNLKCSQLTRQNVLTFVNRSAFSIEQQIPLQNWGANMLGQCWSLSLSQRRFFYLSRVNNSQARTTPALVNYGLDLIGNSETPFKVFSVAEPAIGRSDLMLRMIQGTANPSQRSLRTEIEARQQSRFYDLGNLDLLTSEVEFSRRHNETTMHSIRLAMKQGRMPLLIVRATLGSQHAVLVKRIEKQEASAYRIYVYDSNRPFGEGTIDYNRGVFTAYELVGLYDPDNANKNIGVTIRDEEDMDQLQTALFEHYKRACNVRK